MTEAERRVALEQIADEVRACTRCRLHEQRRRAVPGEGNPDTEVVFVGEGPGQHEDREGRPFVGAAGGFLTELLGSIGWRREDVFITNVVKCRPPGNRDPEPDEVATCAPFLRRQLEALDPALVVTLGRHSLGRFMPGARIGQVHGTSRPADPGLGAADAMTFAMYHPAAALHQGSLRQTLLDDMQAVPAALLAARERRERQTTEGVGAGTGATESVQPAAPPSPDPTALVAPAVDVPPMSLDGTGHDPAPARTGKLVTVGAAAHGDAAGDSRTADHHADIAAAFSPPAAFSSAPEPRDVDPSADQLTLF